MQETRTFDRRTFTLEAALAVLSGVAITISGCGGDGGGPTTPTPTPAPAPTPTPSSDKVGSVSANHGHTAVIEAARLTAGNAISLDIEGTAGHPHTVALSAADIFDIAANRRVSRESTNNEAHNHVVTFN